jgi:LPS export ABC transporter protein LptC
VYVDARNVLGFAALAAIASASWYFARFDTDDGTAVDSQLQGPLGYYLRNADISIMGDDGRMLYRISARAVEERPAENLTVLSDVAIVYSPLAEVPWEIRADSGEIPGAQRYLDLSGSVELATTESATGEATLIQDSDVSVSLGSERLQAVGMIADLKDDHLELESSVHGLFNP